MNVTDCVREQSSRTAFSPDKERKKHSWERVVKFHDGIIKKEEEKTETQNVGNNLKTNMRIQV